jgi:hypothetical protein
MSHHIKYDFSPEDEVVITAQLPVVHRIFSEMARDTTESTNPRWDHLEMFSDLPVFPMDDSYHTGRLGNPNFLADGKMNLTFFRAVGLNQGIEVRLLARSFSDRQKERIRRKTVKAISDLLERHYAPLISHTATLDGQTIVDESEPMVEVELDLDYGVETASFGVGVEAEPVAEEGEESGDEGSVSGFRQAYERTRPSEGQTTSDTGELSSVDLGEILDSHSS